MAAQFNSVVPLANCATAVFIFACCLEPTAARAELTPDSPQVKRLIERGMKYLETAGDPRLGGKCLIGLCHMKQTGDAKHPRVVEAVEACGRATRGAASDIKQDIYSTGIAIFFLCEVDAEQHSSAIEKLVQSLILRQKQSGGFGYPNTHQHGDTGDTSMTQYAALGLWAAKQHGIAVPREVVERMANWLIRTQDPSGAWGYQGNDPGDYVRVKQTPLRPSLAAAGLGSAYISAHMLGLSAEREDRAIEGLPPAFQRVEEEKPQGDQPQGNNVDRRRMTQAQTDGNRWFSLNMTFEAGTWVYYYIYALERAMSFRELVEDRPLSNLWYERGVRFLEKEIQDNGSWIDREAGVDTAFAVLFLMRGTKKTIETTVSQSYEGLLVGGRGLPKNTSNVRVENGRLVGKSLAKSVDEMLAILSDPRHENYADALQFPPEMDFSALDDAQRAGHLKQLEKIAAAGEPEAKVLALDALARSEELSVAPPLTTALSDEQPRVVLSARDGLRRLSRRFRGFGLSDAPTPAEVEAATEKWRDWFRSVSLETD